MSTSIYEQQPNTSGKVILETTSGELEIELWCTEIPKATRNFIQLCMEGYYDNTIFHRLIKGFMIQGGDPTGSGRGGESCYGEPFQDEFHQRLKFTHRGILAMANPGEANCNNSQFFITFDQCEWLNKKHTIFGKVVGQTIHNLLQLQDLDVGKNDRPIQPPRIIKTTVIQNPYKDIVLRNIKQKQVDSDEDEETEEEKKRRLQAVQKAKKKEQKKLKNKAVLSFQDDDEIENDDDEEEANILNNFQKPKEKKGFKKKRSGMTSSHDAAGNDKLSKETAVDLDELEQKRKEKQLEQQKLDNLKSKLKKSSKGQSQNVEEKSEEQMKKKQKTGELGQSIDKIINNPENQDLQGFKLRKNKKTGKQEIFFQKSGSESGSGSGSDSSDSSSDSDDYVDEKQKQIREKQKKEYEGLVLNELKIKRSGIGSKDDSRASHLRQEKKIMSSLEQRKLKYQQQQKVREQDVLGKLSEFRKKINSEEVKQQKNSWVNHKLKFHITADRAYTIQENKEKTFDKERDEVAMERIEKQKDE